MKTQSSLKRIWCCGLAAVMASLVLYVTPASSAGKLTAHAGGNPTIASGGSWTLPGFATGGVGPFTYSWSPATGLSNPNIAQPTASPSATTTYTLTVTDSLSATDTDLATVTVASAVVAEAGPDRIIPVGGFARLIGSASGGVGPYTYSWSPADGLSDPNIADPIVAPTTTTVYTLTVTDSLGQTWTDTVTVTVLDSPIFQDVPMDYWARVYVEAISIGGITAGCSTTPPLYCPVGSVTRAQMAVFLCRAIPLDLGGPLAQPSFNDVPTNYWAYGFIEDFESAGITAGCSATPPLFCPDQTVTRAQMAVFLCRALSLDTSSPPSTATFNDVPTNYWAYTFIEAFKNAGITSGCVADNPATPENEAQFCPDSTVTRAQMAVFLARAFLGY